VAASLASPPPPSLGQVTLGALSSSTGSVVGDAALGGAIGYVAGGERVTMAVLGASLTAIGGTLGILGTLAYIVITRKS